MHPLGHLLRSLALLLLLASSPIGMTTDPTCEKLRIGQTFIRTFGYGPSTALSLFTSDGMVFADIEPSRFDDIAHKLNLVKLTAKPVDVLYPALQNLKPPDDVSQAAVKKDYSFDLKRCYPFLVKGHLNGFLLPKVTSKETAILLGTFDGTATQVYQVSSVLGTPLYANQAVPVSLTSPDEATVIYMIENQFCIGFRLDYNQAKGMPKVVYYIPTEVLKSCRPIFAKPPTAITYSGQWVYFFTSDGTVLVQEVQGLTAPWTKIHLKVGQEEELNMDSFIECEETVEYIYNGKVKVKVKMTTAQPFFSTLPGFTVLCLGILLLVTGSGYYYQFYYLPGVKRKEKAARRAARGKMRALKGKRPIKKKSPDGKQTSLWTSISSLASRSMLAKHKKEAISPSNSLLRSSAAGGLKRSSTLGSLSPISTPVSTAFSMASGSNDGGGGLSRGTPSSVVMKGLEALRLKMARVKARALKAKWTAMKAK